MRRISRLALATLGSWLSVATLFAGAPIQHAAALVDFSPDRWAENPFPPNVHAVGPGELRTHFGGLDIERYEEVTALGDWGGPPSRLVRMVARKRAQVGRAGDLAARVDAAMTARAGEIITLRHDLHQHPEVSGAEVRTAGIVAERLRGFGLDVRTGVGGHGVVGLLRGGRPGPLVAYRADMDAVSSRDPDPVPFASETLGVRHQCGHDLHVAVGLALAAALSSVRDDVPGSVLFVFQPAEERATGARAMMADGVFAAGKPVAIYGLHTSPFEVGQLATRSGVMMPARDRVRVRASGAGDTAAALQQARAAVQAVSTIGPAQASQPQPEGFVFVQIAPVTPGAGTFEASVTVAGREARERARVALAAGLGAIRVPEVTVTHDYAEKAVAGVTNDAGLTAAATAALVRAFGEAAVPRMANILPAFSEDFGSFQDVVPGVFFFLGVSNSAKGIVGMPHSPGYAADDDAIAFGARAMAAVLLDRLATADPSLSPGDLPRMRGEVRRTGDNQHDSDWPGEAAGRFDPHPDARQGQRAR